MPWVPSANFPEKKPSFGGDSDGRKQSPVRAQRLLTHLEGSSAHIARSSPCGTHPSAATHGSNPPSIPAKTQERFLNNAGLKQRLAEIGEDVNGMAVRRGRTVALRVAVAFGGSIPRLREDLFERKEQFRPSCESPAFGLRASARLVEAVGRSGARPLVEVEASELRPGRRRHRRPLRPRSHGGRTGRHPRACPRPRSASPGSQVHFRDPFG
jgi:hypothetical protein